jgi:hypothetical protein
MVADANAGDGAERQKRGEESFGIAHHGQENRHQHEPRETLLANSMDTLSTT